MKILEIKSNVQFGSNSYIVESDGELMLIDPSASPALVIERYGIDPAMIKYIFLTHAHFDHILYIDEWVEISGVFPTASNHEAKALSNSKLNCYSVFSAQNRGYYGKYNTVKDKDEIKLGTEKFTVIHTPGHTEGSLCLLGNGVLFSGDTVFCGGSVGRCDLPSGNYEKLKTSLKRLCELPDNIKVYPGHNYTTDIKEIKIYHK